MFKTIPTVAVVLGCAAVVAAHELILKSGQKITGTIVGFERGMFRVEAEHGGGLA
jgi:hypothetical protein